ncbi:hypothetical protein JOS77_07925 [Chromobacterium haemolyticum]|nr:hypothetical protein JOS77_07925 [Chromobacterium haemolyticum]
MAATRARAAGTGGAGVGRRGAKARAGRFRGRGQRPGGGRVRGAGGERRGAGLGRAARTGRNYLAQTFSRRLAAPWRVASFTSLTHAQAAGKWQESPDHDAGQPAAELQAPPVLDRFGFPRGAKAGTCLHEIFETISFGVDAAGLRQTVELALAKHGFAPEWGDAACEMVTATLNVELDPGVRLAEVPDGKRLVEMEFMLPAPRLEVAKLAAILSAPEHGLAAPCARRRRSWIFPPCAVFSRASWTWCSSPTGASI